MSRFERSYVSSGPLPPPADVPSSVAKAVPPASAKLHAAEQQKEFPCFCFRHLLHQMRPELKEISAPD